MVTKDHIC